VKSTKYRVIGSIHAEAAPHRENKGQNFKKKSGKYKTSCHSELFLQRQHLMRKKRKKSEKYKTCVVGKKEKIWKVQNIVS